MIVSGNKKQRDLMRAVKSGNLKELKELVKDGYKIDRDNYEFLHISIINDDMPMTKFLISCGVEIETGLGYNMSALMVACDNNNIGLARLLIGVGADVNTWDRNSTDTPLIMAVKHNNYKLVKLLLVHGAQQWEDNHNETIDTAYSFNVDKKILKILKEYQRSDDEYNEEYDNDFYI